MRFLLCLALLTCLPAVSFAASTAPAKPRTALASVRPVFEQSGDFGFCIADHNYTDGRKVTFALSPKKQINIGLTIPNGRFTASSKYDLSIAMGDQNKRSIRASALDEETLLLQMGSNPSFENLLKSSRKMTVGSETNMMDFELPEMAAVLNALNKCIKNNEGAKDERLAASQEVMPESLKSLLTASGFTSIAPMQLAQIPVAERPADYMWRTGNVMAGVRELAVPEKETLSDLIGLHLQGLKENCSGRFRADVGREQVENDLRLRLAEANCSSNNKEDDDEIIVALLFYLTRAGSFVVFTHEAPAAYKSEALAARDKLAQGLLGLAKAGH